MRFRCAQCRALTQVQIPAKITAPVITACSGCGRKHRFAVDRPRAADDQERYRRAKEFAETNQIDLGSAYSVLEGVMTLEAKEPPRPQTSVSHGVWNFMIFSVGAMILAGLGVHVYRVWGDYLGQRGMAMLEPTPAAASTRAHLTAPAEASSVPAPPPPMTVPKTDSTGQVVEVVGPDPRSVLISFCMTGRQSGRREAVEIAPTSPPDASARWGVFRSQDSSAIPLRAILIRKDQRTGRWSAGDGRTPIMTEAPPALPPGTRTVPVSATEAVSDAPAAGGSS